MSTYVLDLETTGVDPSSDVPVQVALLRLNAEGAHPVWIGRCNPGRPIPAGASEIHGITDADVADAPAWLDVARDLHAATTDVTAWAAYNASFDFAMLFRAWRTLGLTVPRRPVLCGYVWARQVWRSKRDREAAGLPNLKLGSVCAALGIALDGAHDAEADARATAEGLVKLKAQILAAGIYRGPRTIDGLSDWTYRCGVDFDLFMLGLDQSRATKPVESETRWAQLYDLMDAAPVAVGGAA